MTVLSHTAKRFADLFIFVSICCKCATVYFGLLKDKMHTETNTKDEKGNEWRQK